MRKPTSLILLAAVTTVIPATAEFRADARQNPRQVREQREEWQQHRDRNGKLFARGNWRAPFKYQSFRVGSQLRPEYFSPGYALDAGRYRLKAPGRNQRWVRHYDDVLLVDMRTRRVLDVKRSFFR